MCACFCPVAACQVGQQSGDLHLVLLMPLLPCAPGQVTPVLGCNGQHSRATRSASAHGRSGGVGGKGFLSVLIHMESWSQNDGPWERKAEQQGSTSAL